MASTNTDLIMPAKLKENFFWLSRVVDVLSAALGDATQAVIGASTNAITAASPAAGGVLNITGDDSGFPVAGTLEIGQCSLAVTLSSVVAGKTFTVNDVPFLCVASGASGNQFNVGGSDTLSATALKNAINASLSAGVAGKVTASSSGAALTLTTTDPYDRTVYPVMGDSTFVHSRSWFGGLEKVAYSQFVGVVTVLARGMDGTEAADHPAGAPIYFTGSASSWLLRQLQGLIGDGTTSVLGVGAGAAQVVRDLEGVFQDQKNDTQTDHLLAHLLSDSLQQYEQHMGVVGPDVYTLRGLTPSYSTAQSDASISSLNSYLKYWNDPVSGSLWSVLVPENVGRLYYLINGGDVLDNKVLSSPLTTLANGTVNGGGAVSIQIVRSVHRYNTSDQNHTYRPGYAAARLQARVTTAGTGAVDLTLMCQGQDGTNGLYFGRPASAQLTFAGVLAGDTITVDGIVFTAVTGAAGARQFDRSGTNPVTAANFAAAYAAELALLNTALTPIDASADTNIVTFALSAPTADQANYEISTSNVTRLALSSGTLTGLTKATIGGGAGANIDGYGADSEQAGATSGNDNPRSFTSTSGITAKLDMTTVGATIPLVNGVTGDRVHQIVTATGNSTGANGAFVVESLPDWMA